MADNERPVFCCAMSIVVVITLGAMSANMVAASLPDTGTGDECALFKATQTDTYNSGHPTFIAIGEADVSEGFSVSMEVLPHPLNHNGVLFAIGWKPDFELTAWSVGQYLVLEFVYSSLSLTVKSPTREHPKMIQIARTTPTPYDVADLHWHSVKATRRDGNWMVRIDDISKSERVVSETDVQLTDKAAFIGGRPGYYHYQFSGVMRRVRVNGESVTLSDMSTQEQVEVVPCSASEVEDFIELMKEEKEQFESIYY